ncbi:MAG: hydantoinase/oxoprolinase family protein [Chloroflexi bacterium]|nr:hydantoinase/oxoprolinase family protein [Chloroflexota bacterium]
MTTKKKKSQALVLGIDTGGTYTDGILLDYHANRVLAAHKSLTTKRDYAIGIEKVIESIQIQDPASIQMVSISTTLATNAIAEGKGKRVALFLIGYDPELIASYQMEQQFATPNYYYFAGGHNLYGAEKDTLALAALLETTVQIKNQIDAIAISSYFSPLNPEHENRAYKALSQVCDLPIVLGHQLSTKLGSVERATTAALNASLLSILQDFIVAVRRAMENRGIDAPLMVVRGDGTLMSDEFAARTPVETIHSGPAASAIGGRFLSHLDNALVIDVGGTTTDLALVQDGAVTISETGASVSGFKTSVKAANLLSIGLGGDSYITVNRENNIVIGPRRVVPLAYLAHQHKFIGTRLKALTQKTWPPPTPDWLEFWFLLRAPDRTHTFSDREKMLIKILGEGPIAVPELIKKMSALHKNQLGADPLIRREIIGIAGLTPTDLLHIDGRHTPWDKDAAAYGLQLLTNHLHWDTEGLTDFVWTRISEIIAKAVVEFLTGKNIPSDSGYKADIGPWFFHNSLSPQHPHLDTQIRLQHPIIGIGAPAEIMLADVAKRLHTDLILPDHYFVANAVGAVAGSIMVSEEILVYPRLSGTGIDVISYYVQSRDEREEFEELTDAIAYARNAGRERVLNAALRSGADNPEVIMDQITDGMDTYRIRLQAVGKPRLSK